MSTLTPKEAAGTKVIAKACTLVDRRQDAKAAPEAQKARAVGKLKVAGRELDEAVQQYRSIGGQP